MARGLVINNLDQNTEEWFRWRASGIGGSDAGVIKLGDVYGKTPLHLWQEKRGMEVQSYSTPVKDDHLKRGHELEPQARQYFIENTGIIVKPMLMQSTLYPFMLASLDGMTQDLRVGVEIKAPGQKIFETFLRSGIPEHYYAQIQHQLFVTGAEKFYFFAYNKDIAPYTYLEEIEPNYTYMENLAHMEQDFWRHVEYGIAPTETLNMQDSLSLFSGLIMLAGYANSGKDTIGELYQGLFSIQRFSPSDPLRKIHAMIIGKPEREIALEKELYRDGMVALGHEMRQLVPDVWIQSTFNEKSGIFEAMQKYGAVITSTRYVNEVMWGQRYAKELGVPFRLIYIDRPKIKPANETEGASLPLVKALTNIELVNDMDVTTPLGLKATQLAVTRTMNHFYSGVHVRIASSDFKNTAKELLKAKE